MMLLNSLKVKRLQRLSSVSLFETNNQARATKTSGETFAEKICARNEECFLNKEQVDSVDANEIHEKQSEETLSDIKAKKMEKFLSYPFILLLPSLTLFAVYCFWHTK